MTAARGKTRAAHRSVRSLASDPLVGMQHENVCIPEWGGAKVIVRAPSLADRLFHMEHVRKVCGIVQGDSPRTVKRKLQATANHQVSAASMVVRVLFEVTSEGHRRVFADDDVDLVAQAYAEPHARIFAKAIELGALGEGAQDSAKKPSEQTPNSSSS